MALVLALLSYAYSNPIFSKPSSNPLFSLLLKSENGLGAASPAAVLYICLTSMVPSALGKVSSTLGRLGCCATAVRGVMGVVGVFAPLERSPPLRRGHLRFAGGGGGMVENVL